MEPWQLEQLQQGTTYHLTWLGPGLFRIENNSVHCDLLVGNHHALLWDTGYGYDDLYGLVRRITDLPLYVVNSHGHLDHSCGNWQFESVFIHPEDVELCHFHNSERVRRPKPGRVIPIGFAEDLYCRQTCGSLRTVCVGQVFELGGKTLEVVHLPGHTPGSIGLLYREERALYVGDAINNFVWLFLPEALPLSTYRRTLEYAQSLDFDWMIQSHTREILPKSRLQWYLDLVEHFDYEQGMPVPSPIPGLAFSDCRICIRGGLTLADRDREDFAAILISPDKLH